MVRERKQINIRIFRNPIKPILMKFFLISILNLFFQMKCNLWDNFFSQLKSPHYQIPDEFTLMLFKDNINVMNASSSYDLNSFKISLFQNPLSQIKEEKLKFLDGNWNYTSSGNYELNKSKSFDENHSIMDIYVNFTQGMIYFDYPESCKYINSSELSKFSSKFFLSSYELLTLFEADDLFYNYILMNPLNNIDINISKDFLEKVPNENTINYKFAELKKNTIIQQLINLLSKMGLFNILTGKEILKYNEDFQIYFRIDKREEKLKIISIIYKGFNLVNLDVKTINVIHPKSYFEPQNSNCTLFNSTFPNETGPK